jgi:hypothetical protein
MADQENRPAPGPRSSTEADDADQENEPSSAAASGGGSDDPPSDPHGHDDLPFGDDPQENQGDDAASGGS